MFQNLESFSIFFQRTKFMQQELAVLTGRSLLENVTAPKDEKEKAETAEKFPFSYFLWQRTFHLLPSKKVKKASL